ncbi:membrane protein [Photobacterium marinum]|uniref:Membrane protein n=1 Tax=Photobacterium marinum TaxID=1056511 RepID=L8J2W7_9GAMM|nr:hypothetical protein [Photobacterium marinum]ELR63091.1 membrane protein [Photobacterium marinum]
MYEVVFDISQMAKPWANILNIIPLIFMPFLSWVLYSSLKSKEGNNKLFKAFITAFCLMAMSMFLIDLVRPFYSQSQGVKKLNNGDYKVVKGIIYDFKPQVSSGQGVETFKVGNRKFYYDYYASTSCFNRTKAFGGKVDNGKRVKVYFDNNCILKIEMLNVSK